MKETGEEIPYGWYPYCGWILSQFLDCLILRLRLRNDSLKQTRNCLSELECLQKPFCSGFYSTRMTSRSHDGWSRSDMGNQIVSSDSFLHFLLNLSQSLNSLTNSIFSWVSMLMSQTERRFQFSSLFLRKFCRMIFFRKHRKFIEFPVSSDAHSKIKNHRKLNFPYQRE